MRALSALVAAHRAPLEESLAAAAQLDGVAARAALGAAWGARVPAVGEQGVVRLDGATHPLLASSTTSAATTTAGGVPAAVGNRLELGGEGCPQGLVLTGPNGGGKAEAATEEVAREGEGTAEATVEAERAAGATAEADYLPYLLTYLPTYL